MGMIKMTLLVLLSLVLHVANAHAQTCSAYNDGLVGYWKFDDGAGSSTAADSSGNGNTGTLTNMDVNNNWVTGRVGGALQFNDADTNDKVLVSDAASIQNLTTMTACAWVYPTQLGVSQWPMIMDKSSDGVDSWNLYIDDLNGDFVSFYDRQRINKGLGSVSENTWAHICGTSDFSNTTAGVKVYKDGVLLTGGGSDGGATGDDVGHTISIGLANDGTQWFNGIIDELMLFNRELDATEIAAIYNGQIQAVDGDPGTIIYNEDSAALQYCDGTEWRMAGVGSYNPSAVEFDGANDYLLQNSALTGVADSTKFAASFWFRLSQQGTDTEQDIFKPDWGRFQLEIQDGGTNDDNYYVDFYTTDTGGTTVAYAESSETLVPGVWYHALMSTDSSQNISHLYINDASDIGYQENNGGTIDFTDPTPQYGVGAHVDGSFKFNGALADLWIDFDTYIDFSVEANRRKFISESGMPIYLGTDGSIPTGNPPDIFLTGGDGVTFSSNRGSGGGFTENGAITYSSSQPGDSIIPIKVGGVCQYNTCSAGSYTEEDSVSITDLGRDDYVSGMYSDDGYVYLAIQEDKLAAYSFDGTTLTEVAHDVDICGGGRALDVTGDGTYIYVTTGVFQTRLCALTFNGVEFTEAGFIDANAGAGVHYDNGYIYVGRRDNGLYAYTFDGSSFTQVGHWDSVTAGHDGIKEVKTGNGYVYAGSSDTFATNAGGSIYVLSFDGTSFTLLDDVEVDAGTDGMNIEAGGEYLFAFNTISSDDNIIAYSFDGSTLTEVDRFDVDTVIGGAGSDFFVEPGGRYIHAQSNTGSGFTLSSYSFDGSTISNISSINATTASGGNELYSDGEYIYAASDQTELFAFSGYKGCYCAPETAGTIQYNANYNVMEYFNGLEWVAMGPVGGTPPTSGLVHHWALDETSGATITDSAGSSNGTWVDGDDDTVADENISGIVGTALTFDGTDDEISVADAASLETQTNMSVSVWAKMDTEGTSQQKVLFKDHSAAPWLGWEISFTSSEEIMFDVANTASSYFSVGSEPAELGTWYHIVGIKAGNDLSMYVNGEEATYWNTGPFTGTMLDSDMPLYIGSSNSADYLDGQIDDIRIYDRVLSPTEIQQLYNYGLSGGLGDADNGCANVGSITGATAEGIMLYNTDNNVLQYCNGEEWVGVGQ